MSSTASHTNKKSWPKRALSLTLLCDLVVIGISGQGVTYAMVFRGAVLWVKWMNTLVLVAVSLLKWMLESYINNYQILHSICDDENVNFLETPQNFPKCVFRGAHVLLKGAMLPCGLHPVSSAPLLCCNKFHYELLLVSVVKGLQKVWQFLQVWKQQFQQQQKYCTF